MNHPDIEQFIELRKTKDLKAMNISCVIDDKFMEAVKNDTIYKLEFYVKETDEIICHAVKAKELYDKLCYMAWDYGDPGVLFIDTIRDNNLVSMDPAHFKIDICNPCAEYTGPAYNSCNLGSINLYNFVKDKFTEQAYFDSEAFSEAIYTAVKVLDDILDYGYELQPLDKNREVIDKWRAIGLGIFGFADALIALKIPYGSEKSIQFAETISFILMDRALYASSCIAGKKGSSYGEFNSSLMNNSPLFKRLKEGSKHIAAKFNYDEGITQLRNAQLISIAPTGSLALLAGSLSSGIEPVYKCIYERSTHSLEDSNVHFQVADRAVAELLEYHNIDPTTMTSEKIKKLFPFVVEAEDLKPLDRVAVQAALQKYIDNAISSTVNLPESATIDDVKEIFMTAWEKGLKGITVFRDNCKRASILGFSTKKEEEKKEEVIENTKKDLNTIEPISRKNKGPLDGRTYRKRTACVKALYITINRDENGNLFEVFTNKSTHGCSANIATITRLVSLALRSGVKVPTIIQELKENACQACQSIIAKYPEYGVSLSCPYAIGEVLEEEYKKINEFAEIKEEQDIKQANQEVVLAQKDEELELKNATICPECNERTLIMEGKCVTCKRCGYSKCD